MEDKEYENKQLTDYTGCILEDELDPTVLVDEFVSYFPFACS